MSPAREREEKKKGSLLVVIDDKGLDFTVLEGGTPTCRIVNLVSAATLTARDEDVVMAIVDVGNDTVTLVHSRADRREIRMLEALATGEAELVDLGPVDEATASIASVLLKPIVEGARIAAITTGCDVHGDGSDGATGRADGVGRTCSKTILAPTAVALKPFWDASHTVASIIGSRHSCNKASNNNNSNKTHNG